MCQEPHLCAKIYGAINGKIVSASIYWKAKNHTSYLNSLELSTAYVEVKTEKECQGIIRAETALAVSI